MAGEDLYAVLGVLPDAEEVVVVAAYRALAKRYHPDVWKGDPADAHRRMSTINKAYSVLGDSARRAEYDKSRAHTSQAEYTADDNQDQSEAFDSALRDVEDRWTVACSIYSDLRDLRAMLAQLSASLAFSFVNDLLETKTYSRRAEIAAHMEQAFLERYFGSNSRVLDYARSLIRSGQTPAAKALNRLVVVMGTEVDPDLLIARIDDDFGFNSQRKKTEQAQETLRVAIREAGLEELAQAVRSHGYYEGALKLANGLRYTTKEVTGKVLWTNEIVVVTPSNETLRFENRKDFIAWVQRTLCVNINKSNNKKDEAASKQRPSSFDSSTQPGSEDAPVDENRYDDNVPKHNYQDGLKKDGNKTGETISSIYITIAFGILFLKLSYYLSGSVLDLLGSNYYGEDRGTNAIIGAVCGGAGGLLGYFVTKLINNISISRNKKIVISWGLCIATLFLTAYIIDLIQ